MTPAPALIIAAHNAIATAIDCGTSCGWEKGEVVLGLDAAERVARMLGKVKGEQVVVERKAVGDGRRD